MPEQLTHHTTHFKSKKQATVLICNAVSSPANIGGLFRICDALGVEKIFFCGNTIDLTSSRLKKTSRSTHTRVPFEDDLEITDVIQELQTKNYTIVALELTTKSKALKDYKISENKPLALVIGNEKTGISKNVLSQVLCHVHIEMLGNNSSMNVTQATAIALYYLAK